MASNRCSFRFPLPNQVARYQCPLARISNTIHIKPKPKLSLYIFIFRTYFLFFCEFRILRVCGTVVAVSTTSSESLTTCFEFWMRSLCPGRAVAHHLSYFYSRLPGGTVTTTTYIYPTNIYEHIHAHLRARYGHIDRNRAGEVNQVLSLVISVPIWRGLVWSGLVSSVQFSSLRFAGLSLRARRVMFVA